MLDIKYMSMDANLIDNNTFIENIEPEPAFQWLQKIKGNSEYIKCPAVAKILKNTYVIKSPYTLTISGKDEGTIEVFWENTVRDMGYFANNIVVHPKEKNELMTISLPPKYAFIVNSKEPVFIKSLPLMFMPSKVAVICGEFDISKWIRPVNYAFQMANNSDVVTIKKGDPLFMVQFILNNDEQINLIPAKITEEITKAIKKCMELKSETPNQNLKQRYISFSKYLNSIRETL